MAITVAPALADLDPAGYRCHPLHDDTRDWPETNCYVDVWIELLHALGFDPMPAFAFALACDFDGEQWEFFKFPAEDLRSLFGFEVNEANVWRPLASHIREHLRLGHLLTVEVDSWFLPDTVGVAYRTQHQKTTIIPVAIDEANARMRYFHNRGVFDLSGADYEAVTRARPTSAELAPYVEVIKLDGLRRRPETELHERSVALGVCALARRPMTNPVSRLAARIDTDLPWLRASEGELFHGYAFGTLRQCGAWAQSVAAFTTLFAPHTTAAATFSEMSGQAKVCQFMLARAAAGRRSDLATALATLAQLWDLAYEALLTEYANRLDR